MPALFPALFASLYLALVSALCCFASYCKKQKGAAQPRPSFRLRITDYFAPTHVSPSLLSGISRYRFPVAAKIALYSAGANGGKPGSPILAGGASLGTMYM